MKNLLKTIGMVAAALTLAACCRMVEVPPAQVVQREAVDSRVLELRKLENDRLWIEKWNGQLPTTSMGNAVPMVQLGGK